MASGEDDAGMSTPRNFFSAVECHVYADIGVISRLGSIVVPDQDARLGLGEYHPNPVKTCDRPTMSDCPYVGIGWPFASLGVPSLFSCTSPIENSCMTSRA